MGKLEELQKRIQSCLRPEFLKPKYRAVLSRIPKERRHLYGQCYVASEALFFLLGGKNAGWVPVNLTTRTGPHWYIKNRSTGKIIDPTAGQFACELDYTKGINKGFLTKKPSKNAQKIIDCVNNEA